jgi:L-lactate dehydrogenase complex protein LldG
MIDARAAILARIRSATARDAESGCEDGDAAAEFAAIARSYARSGGLDAEARLRLFIDRLHDYDALVVETCADSLSDTIAAVLEKHWQLNVVVADGFPAEYLPEGFGYVAERDACLEDLNECDGIVTACSVAIASTGTLVLTHGPGEGARRLTLLPDRHLCVVRAEQVVETVPEAFARLADRKTHPLTLISGPSATADIEMTRIRGVHGPRFLDVVLVR